MRVRLLSYHLHEERVTTPRKEAHMRFDRFSFGTIRIDGTTCEHDVVIDRGEVCQRKKGPSKQFRDAFGHTCAPQKVRTHRKRCAFPDHLTSSPSHRLERVIPQVTMLRTVQLLQSSLLILITLVVQGIQFLRWALSSRAALSAEVLFLRKQLAFYQEHQISPHKLTAAARFSLVLWSRSSTGERR